MQVVATRLPESPHEAPASIEVLTGDDLRGLGATTLKDALVLATGVATAPGGDGGPAGSVPEFWGLRELDAFLLVVDGVPWGGAFNPALTSLSLRDVERIEVLRGPAPVTFGATSFVGVIHVVHQAAAATRRYASVSAGSYGSGAGAVDLAIPSSGPWKSRLSLDGERQGFRDDRTSFARGHALWRTTHTAGDQRLWFLADVNVLQQKPASPHPRQGQALSAEVPLDANHNPDGASLDENRVNVGLGYDRPVGAARLGAVVSFTHTSHDNFRGFLTSVSVEPPNAVGLRQTIDTTDLYADAHLALPERRHVRLVVGADWLHGMGDSKGAVFSYTAPLDGASATSAARPADMPLGSEDRREFFGGYGLAEWRPTTRVTLSAGLRLNLTAEKREEGDEAGARIAGMGRDSQTLTRVSGSLGALVSLWEQGANHARVFAVYRNTFKPAIFDFGLGEAGESGLLNPETAQSVEGGLKVRTFEGRADFEASAFRMDFTNLVTATVVNGLPALLNAGETRFQGAEVAAGLHLPHHMTGRLSYSFHDGRFVDSERAFDGVVTQLAGKRSEMSPRHLVSAGAYVAPDDGPIASLVVRYTGDRYMDKRNRALAAGFATVDLGVGYRSGHYELRLDGRNLGDARDVRVNLGVRF